MNLTSLNFTRDPKVCHEMLTAAFKPKDGYFSKVNLAKKKKGKFIPAGFFGTNEPEKFIPNVIKKADLYICKNGMTKINSWEKDNVSTLHTFMFDLDCHDDICNYDDIDSAAYLLYELLISENIFPNVVNITGRGIQLLWFVEPLPVSMLNYYNAVVNMFMDTIENVLKNAAETYKKNKLKFSVKKANQYIALGKMHIDKKASTTPSGLMRFPGSYNVWAGRYGKFSYQHDNKLDVMKEFFENHLTCENPKTQNVQKNIKRKKEVETDLVKCRESMLHGLVEMRKNEGQSLVHKRDFILHFLAAAYISSGHDVDETMAAVMKLNQQFDVPMPSKEVVGYMSTTLRKGYKYTNAKIIDTLEMTEEEQVALGFFVSSKESELVKRRSKRKERNEQILELYKNGKTQVEIAQQLNISQSTVCRLLNKNGVVKKVKKIKKTKYSVKDIIRKLREKRNPDKRQWCVKRFVKDIKEVKINSREKICILPLYLIVVLRRPVP